MKKLTGSRSQADFAPFTPGEQPHFYTLSRGSVQPAIHGRHCIQFTAKGLSCDRREPDSLVLSGVYGGGNGTACPAVALAKVEAFERDARVGHRVVDQRPVQKAEGSDAAGKLTSDPPGSQVWPDFAPAMP
jgi:hypothetical protein